MSIKAISSVNSVNNQNNLNELKYKNKNQQSFTGSFNPVVTLMDAIDKGGFAASFIAQDGLGMVTPRIYEGLNRNRKRDENGKKTGPLNWEFARREGIREILSGPSAFLIPLGILTIIKKASGTANNVHVSHIKALGEDFATYAAQHPEQLDKTKEFKQGYYAKVFENALTNSTDEEFKNKISETAKKFADKLVDIEEKRSSSDKKLKKEGKKLQAEIVEEYMKIRKQYAPPSVNELEASLKVEGSKNPVYTDIRRLTQSLTDYTGDALSKVNKFLKANANGNIDEYIKKFNVHRAGTRVLSNLGMWAAVVGFYTLIPKLYNLGLKHDPGLAGLEEEPQKAQPTKPGDVKDKKLAKADDKSDKDKNVAFTGLAANVGKTAMTENSLSKLLKNFEFNGASMSVPAMLTLLFGFCLPPRYKNAKSDKERKEILVRDIASFTSILFGAKALSRGFSDAFAKMSGLTLNVKPEDHSKSIFHKFKNYFTAGSGVNVLTSEQIVSKYSHIDEYKDGILGFFKFLEENGGNVKKVLKIDKTVKEQSEKILKKFGNVNSIEEASLDTIHKAFEKAKNTAELEKIYSVFSSKDNKFINRAKTFNSAFGFASTLILVPAFMMWLARYCENMTKKAVEKEKAQKAAAANGQTAPQPQTNTTATTTAQAVQSAKQTPNTKQTETKAEAKNTPTIDTTITGTKKLSMAGFLNQ